MVYEMYNGYKIVYLGLNSFKVELDLETKYFSDIESAKVYIDKYADIEFMKWGLGIL